MLPQFDVGIFAALKIGLLSPDCRSMAEALIYAMPNEYTEAVSDETSALMLVRLSEKLLNEKKIGEMEKRELDRLIVACNTQPFGSGGRERTAQDARKDKMPKPHMKNRLLENNELLPLRPAKRKERQANIRLILDEYANHIGNAEELKRLNTAMEAVDAFYEMKSPAGKADFDPKEAWDLYRYLFPDKNEREPVGEIKERLDRMLKLVNSKELQRHYQDSRFHAITGVSKGSVVAYTQFSTMPLGNDQTVVFWQYGGTADDKYMAEKHGRQNETFRELGVASAFYVFRHGIAEHDAEKMGRKGGCVGTILESEMKGMGPDEESIRFTEKRLRIHNRMGAKIMMLEMEDGTLLNAHLQPRLTPTTQPIILHMMFRPKNYDSSKIGETEMMDKGMAEKLVMSFVDNFDVEGFDKKDVEFARTIMRERLANTKRVLLLPPEKVPNIIELAKMDPILMEQVVHDYGSLGKLEAMIKSATDKPDGPVKHLGS